MSLYAVVVNVEIDPARADEAFDVLEHQIVPMTKGLPGFVKAMWLTAGDRTHGIALTVVGSEEQAQQLATQMDQPAPSGGPARPIGVQVMEVTAEA